MERKVKTMMNETMRQYCEALAAAVAINDQDAIKETEGLIVEAVMLEAGYVFDTDTGKYEIEGK